MPQGPVFGPASKVLVVLSDPQHGGLSLRIVHLIRENASLFCAGAPVFGVVSVAIHSRPPICCNFVTPEQCCLCVSFDEVSRARVSSSQAAPTFVSCCAPQCGHSKRTELDQMRAKVA